MARDDNLAVLERLRDRGTTCSVAGETVALERPDPESARAVRRLFLAQAERRDELGGERQDGDPDLVEDYCVVVALAVSAVTGLEIADAAELLERSLHERSELPARAARMCGVGTIGDALADIYCCPTTRRPAAEEAPRDDLPFSSRGRSDAQ